MKLYAITISGKKFYFWGEMPSCVVQEIDNRCREISGRTTNKNAQKVFNSILEYIVINYDCQVIPSRIEHIFRINL